MERAGDISREGLTSTDLPDLPMKWQVIGVVSLYALCLDLSSHSHCIDFYSGVFPGICMVYAARLVSQAQRLKGPIFFIYSIQK